MNCMKKNIVIVISAVSIVIIGSALWLWQARKTNPRVACLKVAGTGWGPIGPKENAPFGCDGKLLDSGSPLIDKDGYTCWCHEKNTCWNGETCVLAPTNK